MDQIMVYIDDIYNILIIPLLTVLAGFLIRFIQVKSQEIMLKVNNNTANKYIKMFTETVITCVIATNQTYVESLKAQGKFDAEAQKIAFEKTKKAVLAVLAEDAKNYLTNMVGDFNAYLDQTIETVVNTSK